MAIFEDSEVQFGFICRQFDDLGQPYERGDVVKVFALFDDFVYVTK